MSFVSESEISELVDTFYGKIRDDDLLGPIFETALHGEWDPHLAKMKAFWSSVMLATGTYKGNPMMAHLRLPRLTGAHLNRWLELWRETTSAICAEPKAAYLFVEKAAMIGERFVLASLHYHPYDPKESGRTLETA
ncbi:MAG TPA: group III truncated hemoglobin [Bryobacteraceae bacterium]